MSRSQIKGFQKERLSQILAARRYTQAQLAFKIGVSPATLSKWKSGTQTPEKEALVRLAQEVNVTTEWFTRPILSSITLPLFRSNATAHVAARNMLETRMMWALDVALSLSEFVDFPDVNLPERDFTNPDLITPYDIEAAAQECRDLWNLGRNTIQDLALAVESAGIILVREETGITQIEGLSAWSDFMGRPLILLSADKDNAYRSRFDLAHELGHLILHRHIKNPIERERHNLLEKQAHHFAGAFLLPAESFAKEVRTPVTLDDLLLLKHRWGVSVAAIIMRLKALKIIDESTVQLLFKRRSARWGARSEPNDSDRKPEQTRLLKRTVDLLVDENIMPLEAIPRHIGLGARDIEMLLGFPVGHFDKKNNIVQLARMKKITNNKNSTSSEESSNVISFSSRVVID